MRMKKAVSAFAALTIAAGAFAGMAVTASAAEVTADDVVFGVYDSETKMVSPQEEFTVDAGEGSTYTYIDTTYMEGSVLVGNQSGGRNYNFLDAVTSGKVKLAMNYTIPASGTKNVWNIMGKNSSGEDIIIASSVSGIGNGNWDTATLLSVKDVSGETVTVTGTNYQPRTRNCFILRDLTIDIDQKTLTYDFLTYPGGSGGSLNDETRAVSGTINLPADIVSITGLNVPRNGGSYNMNMDNIMFYHIPIDEGVATTLTVNYVSGESVVGSKIIDVSSNKVGDTVDYTFPAYVTGSDGTIYSAEADTFKASKELTAVKDTVNVSYIPINETAQYMEFDGNVNIANSDKASNGAMTNGIQNGIDTIKINEDGVYTVTVATGRTSEEATSNRYGVWYINDNTEDTKELAFSGPDPGAHSYESIELHSGDIIKVKGSNSKCALDYVLIVKTDDIDPEPTLPGETEAKLVKDFNDQDLADAENGASIWSATVEGTGTSYSSMTATVKAKGIAEPASDTKNVATITTTGDVLVYVVVNRASEKLDSVKITVE